MTDYRDRVLPISKTVVDWAKAQQGIHGVALLGSHARDQARPDSDIDLLLIADNPTDFRPGAWLADIAWHRVGTRPIRWADEEYGAVWSRRVWLNPARELEITFAPLRWADVSPVDDGTGRVVSNGCRILYDPDGLLARLTSAIARHDD